jgi:hypothetical protein
MRATKITLAGVFLALVFPGPRAFAEALSDRFSDSSRCEDRVVEAVGEHFGLGDFSYTSRHVVAGVCKSWPPNQRWMIAAFAYGEEIEYEKALLLAVIDVPKNRIIASYKGTIPEDGGMRVNDYSLQLDTGRYHLSKTTRAFGVRVHAHHGGCAHDGGLDDDLTLFIMEGNAIRPVFSQTMHYWSYGPGDRCSNWKEVTQIDTYITLSVEPTSTKGFADLKLTAKTDRRKPVSVIVKYNGKNYDSAPYGWWER